MLNDRTLKKNNAVWTEPSSKPEEPMYNLRQWFSDEATNAIRIQSTLIVKLNDYCIFDLPITSDVFTNRSKYMFLSSG